MASYVHLPKIHPNLYLGNVQANHMTLDGDGPAKYSVCVASDRTCGRCSETSDTCEAFGGFGDTPLMSASDFHETIDKAADAIAKQLQRGNTMVNCYAGINRSVASITAYASKHRGMGVSDTVNYIRYRNRVKRGLPALTNKTFVKHLLTSENDRTLRAAKAYIKSGEAGKKASSALRKLFNSRVRSMRR